MAISYYVSYGHPSPQSCMMYNEQELFSWKTDYYLKPTLLDYKQWYKFLNQAGLVGLTISHLNISASFVGQAGIQLLQTEPCLPCSHLLATLLPESPSKDEAYGLDIVTVCKPHAY